MSREHYELMLAELGNAVNLPLEADDTGYSSLEIDGSLIANMQYVESSDSIYIFYELGQIDSQVLDKVCVRLLAANLFGVETGGGVLAIHEDCEGAREMRIFRKRNENVPEHFLCFGTFFE